MDDNQRLSRIEAKLDKLADAVISLARMEERMAALFNRMSKYDDKQEELEDRVDEISMKVSTNGTTLRFAERIFWIGASASVSYLFWTLR